jgi:hypothetical protein
MDMTQRKTDRIMVHLNGHYNYFSIDTMKSAVAELLLGNPKLIIVDCERLEGLDASMISFLIFCTFKAKINKITVIFYNIDPALKPVLQCANLFNYASFFCREKLDPAFISRLMEGSGHVEVSPVM